MNNDKSRDVRSIISQISFKKNIASDTSISSLQQQEASTIIEEIKDQDTERTVDNESNKEIPIQNIDNPLTEISHDHLEEESTLEESNREELNQKLINEEIKRNVPEITEVHGAPEDTEELIDNELNDKSKDYKEEEP